MSAPTPARPPDWRQISELLEDAGLPTSDLEPEHVARFHIVRQRGEIVGCVAVEPYGEWGLLRSLAVAREARGQGLGGLLVDAAVDRARRDGIAHLVLLTETAEPFFSSRGWEPVERSALSEAVRQSSEFCGSCCARAACLAREVEGKPMRPG